MELDNTIKKFIFSSFSKLIASLGLILFNLVVINILNKEALGILTLAISLITFLSIFSKFGLNHATLRFASIFYNNKDKRKILNLIFQVVIISGVISSIISVTLIIFQEQIALKIYNNYDVVNVLKFFAISLPIFTFIQIQKSMLRSFKLPELSNFSDIGSILFVCCFVIFIYYLNQINISVHEISLIFLFSCTFIFFVNNYILFISVISNLKFSENINTFDQKKKLIKTLPDYFFIDLVNYILVWGSIFICTFFYDAKTIGIFSSTYWFAYSLLFFPLVLNSIYAPKYAINSEKKNKINLKNKFNQNKNISLIISFPIFFVIFIFSEFFLNTFFQIYSNEYILILRILLMNAMLRVVFGPQVLFLNMINKQKRLKSISIICAIFQIILIFISVINFNLVILSLAFLTSNLIKHLWLKIELQKYFMKKL